MMMALRRFTLALLIEILIILPIFEARSYQEYNSYKQFYNSDKELKYSPNSTQIISEWFNSLNDSNEKGEIKLRLRDNSNRVDEESIVFPEYELQTRNDDTNAEVLIDSVSTCEGQTFCEDVPNYPQDLVNRALAKDSSLLHYANIDVLDTSIAHRIDSGDEELCISTEQLIHPKSAENVNKRWMHIVQSSKSNFTQAIRVEICRGNDSNCRVIDGFAEGYVTICKQKYIYRQLLAISKEGAVVRDYFRFPASCCCHVQFLGGSDRWKN